MKTASTLLQILALGACLIAYLSGTGDTQITGVRRALQTMAVSDFTLPSMAGQSYTDF